MAIQLPKGSIMHWIKDGQTYIPTEHNRKALNVDLEPIGDSTRMANGRRRSQWVVDKHNWSCSWDYVPAQTEGTVDGNMGGAAIEDFFATTKGEFTLRIRNSFPDLDGDYQVEFEGGFSKSQEKRGKWDLWTFSVSMVEV